MATSNAGALSLTVRKLTDSLHAKMQDFRGFDSSIILILGVDFSCPQGIPRKF